MIYLCRCVTYSCDYSIQNKNKKRYTIAFARIVNDIRFRFIWSSIVFISSHATLSRLTASKRESNSKCFICKKNGKWFSAPHANCMYESVDLMGLLSTRDNQSNKMDSHDHLFIVCNFYSYCFNMISNCAQTWQFRRKKKMKNTMNEWKWRHCDIYLQI